MTLKQIFKFEAAEKAATAKILVVAVKLPHGAIELITNNDKIATKAEYYNNAYDDDFKLKVNPEVQIVGYMMV